MLTVAQIQRLLDQAESNIVDFKREPHRLDDDGSKSKFIKDILSMANTPRDDVAYIVIGVELHRDGTREYPGTTTHPDDADLQSLLNRAGVEPKPSFVYQPLTFQGKPYGIIEVPVDKTGPFFATRDFGVVKAHRLYFRRGTMNAEATPQEHREIFRWFLNGPKDAETPPLGDQPQVRNWDEFSVACHGFDRNRLYVLVLGPNEHQAKDAWSFLGRLPVSLVLDFDPDTADHGVFSVAAPAIKKLRSVHLWTLDNEGPMAPERACYWYGARGLSGRQTSLVVDGWRNWNRRYGTALHTLLQNLARAAGGRPLTTICLWYAPEYLREICTLIDRLFGDAADYVFAIPEADRLADLADQFKGHAISLRVDDILHSIALNIAAEGDSFLPVAGIPHSDGGFHILERADLAWLSEDIEVLHSNIELETDPKHEVGLDYLRGATITWIDLANHYDADRRETSNMRDLIKADLDTRATTRLNLYHWPGAGGTTVARRIAWDLRRSYPVVILKRIMPSETVSRFRELFRQTGLPILVVVEGGDTVPDRLEHLYSEVRIENIPVAFLNVLRRFEKMPTRSDDPPRSKRSFFLGPSLDLREARWFADAYSRAAPQQSVALEALVGGDPRERTPFQFALAAFGRDFVGITRYVESRLSVATATQRDVMTYLALAYYYGHKPVRSQVFAIHLGQPENRLLHMERVLGELQLELLMQESDGRWRPSHQLIAEEILQIVLSGNAEDRRIWKRNLATWSLGLIRICAGSSLTPSDDVLDLLRRVFILRDEHELLGTESSASTKFARLIEDIDTNEGKLSVFKALVEAFPDEAHFWGHLGRFYSNPMREPQKAIEALDMAIRLSPDDSVLYHMKGMCYRQIAYDQMSELRRKEPTRDQLKELRHTVALALETFAKARELEPDSEHAHISPIQMLIRVLDFGFQVSGQRSQSEFLGHPSASWYRECLDEAESLLDLARSMREGDKLSQYVLDCQARVHKIYDDYARALQDWSNLLSRADVYAPPIRRQIVRTYLARSERNWSALGPREIDRIVSLMEDNLREEPGSEHNIRLWFRAIRYSPRQDMDWALDRLTQWKTIGDSQDAYYYLYVLHVLKAIEGSSVERVRSKELIEQSAKKALHLRNRTFSFEWLGHGTGLGSLIHHSELGEWEEALDFYTDTSRLTRVEGSVAKIKGPEAGTLELSSCSLPVFFVPAKAGAQRGRHENLAVDFFLGFSYDGLRAWSVRFTDDPG